MKNKKSTLINVIAAMITFFVQMFISFWLSPYVVGKLGEEAYSFINLANNFVSYASLLSVAINSMSSRYISVECNSGNRETAKSYFTSVFFVNCILYLFIVVLSVLFVGHIERFINVSPKILNQVKITFILTFVNMGTSLLGTVYTAAAFTTNKMHYNSLVQIIANIIKSIIVFSLFVIFPARIYYLSIATLVAGVLTLMGNYLVTKKLLSDFRIEKKYFDFDKIKILVKSGFWVFVSNLSNMLLNGLDLLFTNWFISSAIAGRLSLAKQIPFALSNVLGIFSSIFSSMLTKVFASDGARSLIDEAQDQLKMLTILFTVPYAGIIVYGVEFLGLWLRNTAYTVEQRHEIYILMLLVLIDIIISTYMYSIHSVFIALDKVKIYSVILFVASCISISSTLVLLQFTNLGVYAIAGTSTVILGFTHGIIVPGCAAKLLDKSIGLFWKSEMKSWVSLLFLCIIFTIAKKFMNFSNWISFFLNIIVIGFIGYILTIIMILDKKEKAGIIAFIKNKIK